MRQLIFLLILLVSIVEGFTVGKNVTCLVKSKGVVECEGTRFENAVEEEDVRGTFAFWLDVGIVIALVILAGLASGLNIGLMSLPILNLQVLLRTGDDRQKAHSSSIMPLVSRHHLLLVTFLLTFAGCIEALPLFLTRLVGDLPTTLGISVGLVLFCVLIIPQAVFKRNALFLGHYLSWFCWVLIVIFGIVAFPISKLLDWTIGDDYSHTMTMGRKELTELVRVQAESERTDVEGEDVAPLFEEDVKIIQGAMRFRDLIVADEYVPLKDVFMIRDTDKLDKKIFQHIRDIGHSRIPVYHGRRDMIVGVLHVFSIIHLSPSDEIPVDELELFDVPRVSAHRPLHTLLSYFTTGSHQIAIVLDPNDQTTPIGIITLEDVLEALVGVEFYDEKDVERRRKEGMVELDSLRSPAMLIANAKPTPDRAAAAVASSSVSLKTILDTKGPGHLRIKTGTDGERFVISRSPEARKSLGPLLETLERADDGTPEEADPLLPRNTPIVIEDLLSSPNRRSINQ